MREKSFDSINVVPFIDIMLVLLTIVLATATFIKTGVIPIELPEVNYSETEQISESIVIDIAADGKIYHDTDEYSPERLRALLDSTSSETHIIVRADKAAEIQVFAMIMSLLKECGFENVNLQTEISN